MAENEKAPAVGAEREFDERLDMRTLKELTFRTNAEPPVVLARVSTDGIKLAGGYGVDLKYVSDDDD